MERKVGSFGEFNLIDRLVGLLDPADVPVGPGDDACALIVKAGHCLLATTDTVVEGVHFRRDWARAWQVGFKTMAVNLSDIAAMGGRPTFALISLAVPGSLEVSWVEEFYRGLEACGTQWGVKVVGGDTVAASEICITLTLLGEAEEGKLLTRSAGRVGDLLLVTGDLGASAAGLEELLSGKSSETDARQEVLSRHLLPVPRVKEGLLLASEPGTGAVIDLSDGLAQGLREIARASKVGVEVYLENLPVSKATIRVAASHGHNPLEYALYGGEDYELLVSVRPSQLARIKAVIETCNTQATVIGCLMPAANGLSLWDHGRQLPLTKGGYDHFLP